MKGIIHSPASLGRVVWVYFDPEPSVPRHHGPCTPPEIWVVSGRVDMVNAREQDDKGTKNQGVMRVGLAIVRNDVRCDQS